MANFSDTYLGQLRALTGERLILVPGARIVLEQPDGRILLQHRSDFGLWGLPGGNAEVGEGAVGLIRRETKEETGLCVPEPLPFGFASDPHFETVTYPNGDRCQFSVVLFFAREFSGVARAADDESHAVNWFCPTDLPSMLPNMVRTVEAYQRYCSTGEFQMI